MRRAFKQKLITLTGELSTDEAIQDMEGWDDTEGTRMLVVSAVVPKLLDCALYVETAASINGPWTSVSIAATGVTLFEADAAATNKLQRYVRWRVDATADDWEACFALEGVTKD